MKTIAEKAGIKEPVTTYTARHSFATVMKRNGASHGYRYNDSDGNELVIRRANVGTIVLPDYFLKQDITFVELK